MSSVSTVSEAVSTENSHSSAAGVFVRLISQSLGLISVTALWQLALRWSEGVNLWHRWAYLWLVIIVMLIELGGPRFDFLHRRLKLLLTVICAGAFVWVGGHFIPSVLFFQILMFVPMGLFIWATRRVMTRPKSVVLIIATLGTMLSLNPLIAHFVPSPPLAKVVSIGLNIIIAALVWRVAQSSMQQGLVSDRFFRVLRALLFVIAQGAVIAWTPADSLFAEIFSTGAFWLFLAAWVILDFFDLGQKTRWLSLPRSGWAEWLTWLVSALVWCTITWVKKS